MMTTSIRKWLVLAGLLVSMVVASPVVAGDGDKAEAEKLFRAGEQAYKAGQYLVAAQAFEQAYKLLPVPAIAFSTAQAYRLQYFIDKDPGWLKRSIELYRRYVNEVDKGGRRDDAVASLAELEPIMLRIEAEQAGPIETRVIASDTQMMVSTQVRGARAAIDGNEGETPLVRKVEPGPHKIRVTADGYFPVEQEATAVEGKFLPVEITLRPKPALVKVRTEGGSRVTVDGRPVGSAPLARPLELAAGKHFVAVTHRGRYGWSKEISVARGEAVELGAGLEKTLQRKISYWVLGASGLALAITGITTFQALSADSDAQALDDKRRQEGITPDQLNDYFAKVELRDARRRDSLIWLGITGAIGATGMLLWLLDNPRADAPPFQSPAETETESKPGALSWTPVVVHEGAGVVVGGSF
jgi:hypothetical protein